MVERVFIELCALPVRVAYCRYILRYNQPLVEVI